MGLVRVSRIQRYSVHDGDGIRTTVFLAGCPLRCSWCCNPETWDPDPHPASYPQGAPMLLGRLMSAEAILAEIRRDLIFFRSSGGGVTWSGGEPFFLPAALASLVDACADLGINQGAETSGFFPWSSCEGIVRKLDFLFIDIKHMDSDAHARLVGVGNEQILENIERIGLLGIDTVVRLPLVKGVNDGADNLARTAQFVRARIRPSRMEVLPYHDLGRDKYEQLGLASRHVTYGQVRREDIASAEHILAGEGVEIVHYR
jgi:pyruvate formate lyase activating enzyme